MYIVPKHNIFVPNNRKPLFTKGEKYLVEDYYTEGEYAALVTTDDHGARNFISIDGDLISNFLFG